MSEATVKDEFGRSARTPAVLDNSANTEADGSKLASLGNMNGRQFIGHGVTDSPEPSETHSTTLRSNEKTVGGAISAIHDLLWEMGEESHRMNQADIQIFRWELGRLHERYIDSIDHQGQTALHIAARRGLLQAATLLLEKGANVLAADDYGNHALHKASQFGHAKLAQLLLKKNAEIEAKERHGATPLHLACFGGQLETVDLLLENGASSQTKDGTGRIPLMLASINGHGDVVKRLLSKGVPSLETLNVTSQTTGWTALHAAANRGHRSIVKDLLEAGAGLGIVDHEGRTPLMVATQQQHEGVLEELLRRSNDQDLQLEKRDESGRTPLMHASVNGFVAGVKLLLIAGADCNTSSARSDSTALISATNWRCREIVEALLQRKELDIDHQDPLGGTALHTASNQGHSKIASLLLSHKAKIDVQNTRGRQALHLASKQGNEKIVSLLLAEGAEVDAKDRDGITPLHLASQARENQFFQADPEALGPDDLEVDEKGMAVFRSGRHAAVVKLLLAHKADPGAKTKEQLTALHLAAMCGDRSRIDLILEHMSDRDVAAQTTDGSTALDLAFNGDNPAMALESLLKSAKLVTVVFGSAKAQEDALLWAAGSSATHEVVRLLLSKNSDTTKPAASKDWNAIQWAVYKQLPEVLWKLIASSPRTTIDSDGTLLSALEVMKKPAQKSETTQAAHTAEPSLEEKLENSAKKSTQDRIIGILKDPPTALSYRNQKRYDLPSFENKNGLSNLMQDFKASVVQFLETGTHSGSISRTRTVQDVIYDLGPKKIRLDAMADLRRNSGKVFSREDTANASNDGMSNLPQKRFINMEPDLTWVHLPSTNMVWMNDLLRRIMKDEGCNEEQFHEVNSFFRDSWVEIPDSTSASRTMRPRYVMRDPDTDDTGEGKKRTNKGYEGEDRWQRTRSTERPDRGHKGELAVYMPYLSFSIQRREPGNIDDEDSEDEDYMGTVNRKQPTPQEKERLIKVMKSHTELLESYQGHPIHGSSTLDEWYYHFGVDHDSVLDRDSRNMSQVATRCLSGSASVKGLEFWPLIRVNQLWIWTIANKWVITACPDSLDGSATTLVSEVLNHLDKQTEAGGIRDQPRTPTDMARFIVDHCVSSYERKPTAKKDICDELHSSVSIRQIFSKSINSLGRDETNLFKQFRKEIKKRQNRIQGQSNNEEKGPRIDEKIREAIIKAQKLSSHIKDIRDELNILKATAKYQKPIQDALSGDRAMQAGLTASYIVNDIEEMDNVADRLQSAVNTTLSLQQSEIANYQATIANSQAELSVQQGLEGMKQGRTLMVFTVITILFLPMSFLSSMFALDVASFQQAPWWAFVVIFVVSLVIFLPLAAYSIYSERFHEFWASQFGARGDGKTTDETKKHGSIGSLTLVQPSMDEPGSGQTGLEVAVNKRKPSRRWHHVEEGRGLSA